MKLDQIIEKLKEQDIASDVLDAVKALDTSSEVEKLKSELEAEQGKTAGILADKKKYKERAETAESSLKKIEHDKLPEDERRAKELQELNEKLAEAEKAREADKAEFERVQREAKLSDLTGSIKWADATPHDTAKLIIQNAMNEVDLSDKAKVEEVLNSVKEQHKSFIAAEAPGGTGGKGGTGGEKGGNAGEASSIADNQKALWGDK